MILKIAQEEIEQEKKEKEDYHKKVLDQKEFRLKQRSDELLKRKIEFKSTKFSDKAALNVLQEEIEIQKKGKEDNK